jgi:hypothetical protein
MTPEELRSLPKYQIIRSLLDGTIPFHDVMRAFDIHTALYNLGEDLLGMVYLCRHGHYHIVLNSFLEPEHIETVFLHELKHIIEDMPKMGYTIGLDMQYHVLEKEADEYKAKIAAARR